MSAPQTDAATHPTLDDLRAEAMAWGRRPRRRGSWYVTEHMVRAMRAYGWTIIVGAVGQPILYLLLFGPLLKPLVSEFGATNAYTFLVPGLLVQLGMFGAFFAGFGLISEWRDGVVEAERVTPAI